MVCLDFGPWHDWVRRRCNYYARANARPYAKSHPSSCCDYTCGKAHVSCCPVDLLIFTLIQCRSSFFQPTPCAARPFTYVSADGECTNIPDGGSYGKSSNRFKRNVIIWLTPDVMSLLSQLASKTAAMTSLVLMHSASFMTDVASTLLRWASLEHFITLYYIVHRTHPIFYI